MKRAADGREHGMISESMRMGPFIHFFCCEVNSLIRSKAVWNTMTLNEALCKSMNHSFDRALHKGKANP